MFDFDEDREVEEKKDFEECIHEEDFNNTTTAEETTTDSSDYEFDESEAKKIRGYDLWFRIATALAAICVVFGAYMIFGMFNLKERDLREENIYSGNGLIISEDEVCNMISNIEEELGITIDGEDYDSYCLLNAILENENLTDNEKNVFCRAQKIIKDNPYINKEAAYKSLLNVDVSYKKRPFSLNNNTEGAYYPDYESIGVFVKDPDYRVLLHEVIHCIFDNDITKNLPTYFTEGMTELLSNEYFSDSPFLETVNYPFEISLIKMLCEVSSADAVLEAYSTGDMSVIAKEIAKITHDEEGAMEALDMVDKLMQQHNGTIKDEEQVDVDVLINGFIPLFRAVVEAKYDEEDHARVSYFYNEILMANILDEKPYDKYVDDLVEFGLDHKAYFSSELKIKVANEGQLKKIKSADK